MKKYNNNIKFIYEKPLNCLVLTLICILNFVIFSFLILTSKIYDKFEYKGIVNNEKIIVPCLVEDVSRIKNSDKVKIDNDIYDIEILEYSEIYTDGNMNMQDITINSKKEIKENEIVDLTFYYNNELMAKKILKGVLE